MLYDDKSKLADQHTTCRLEKHADQTELDCIIADLKDIRKILLL